MPVTPTAATPTAATSRSPERHRLRVTRSTTGTGYDPGSYPEARYAAGLRRRGHRIPGHGGRVPAVTGDFTDTGAGYADPAYADGPFTDGAGRYPDDGDYPAGDEYLRYGEPAVSRDGGGYPDREGWYEDHRRAQRLGGGRRQRFPARHKRHRQR